MPEAVKQMITDCRLCCHEKHMVMTTLDIAYRVHDGNRDALYKMCTKHANRAFRIGYSVAGLVFSRLANWHRQIASENPPLAASLEPHSSKVCWQCDIEAVDIDPDVDSRLAEVKQSLPEIQPSKSRARGCVAQWGVLAGKVKRAVAELRISPGKHAQTQRAAQSILKRLSTLAHNAENIQQFQAQVRAMCPSKQSSAESFVWGVILRS